MTALEDRMGAGKIGLDESIADASSFEWSILLLECHPRTFHTDGASSFLLWESSAQAVCVTHGQVIDWRCWWMRTEIGRLSAVFKWLSGVGVRLK
jgi:hypothetical protein